ncbi:MAG: TonB-dependent receptor [Pseudomonadota bacterium]
MTPTIRTSIVRTLLAAASVTTIAAVTTPVIAQSGEARQIEVSSRPLAEALVAIGRAYGVTVIAAEELTLGKTSPSVSGALTAEQALAQALDGSGLQVSQSDGGRFVITALNAAASAELTDIIVVRGQRLVRSEFETPSSVNVFTEEDLRRTPGAGDINNLLDFTPNITIGAGNQAPTIRGTDSNGPLSGTDAITGGARPRATTIVDGRVITFNEYVFGATNLYDIDQVEIFRGPQTSVQGANNIAGSIFVFTKDPTYEFEAGLRAEASNFEGRRIAGFVSGPLVDDQLAVRVTGDLQRGEVFEKFGDPSLTDLSGDDFRRDPRQVESFNLRSKLLFEPNEMPDFSAKLTLSHTESFQPSLRQIIPPFEDLIPRSPGIDGRFRVETRSTYGVLDLAYEFGSDFELTNQTTYSDFQITFNDATRAPKAASTIDGAQFSNETILKYEPQDGRVSGLAGVYYFQKDEENDAPALGSVGLEDTQTSLGIYAVATGSLTDKLSLTAALRYQRDTQDRIGSFQIPVPTFPLVEFDFEGVYEAFLPQLEIAYDFTDDVRVGVLASRGTNPGGIVPNVLPASPVNPGGGMVTEFEDEGAWTYELFTRASVLDGKLRFGGNIFYLDYDDFQLVTLIGFTPIPSAVFDIDNIDVAFTYGLEAEVEFDATEKLSFFASLGLLETRLEELNGDGVFERREFGSSPPVTAYFGATYRPVEDLFISAQVRYADEYTSDTGADPNEVVDDVFVANLSAGYTFGPAEVYGYVENLFDEFYVTNVSAGGQFAFAGAPRTFGGGIRLQF